MVFEPGPPGAVLGDIPFGQSPAKSSRTGARPTILGDRVGGFGGEDRLRASGGIECEVGRVGRMVSGRVVQGRGQLEASRRTM